MNSRQKILLGALALAGALYLFSRTKKGQAVVTSITDQIADLITGHEGTRLTAYQDEAGIWTIGKGHKILTTDIVQRAGSPQKLYPFGPVKTITEAEAEALFSADTAGARNAVSNRVMVPLTQNQRAALVSLVFNIGAAAFAASTLLARLNAGRYTEAADQFLVWNKVTVNGVKQVSSGLANRRTAERRLFLS